MVVYWEFRDVEFFGLKILAIHETSYTLVRMTFSSLQHHGSNAFSIGAARLRWMDRKNGKGRGRHAAGKAPGIAQDESRPGRRVNLTRK